MPRPGGGGFEQSYNGQAAVDTDSMLIVATDLVNTPSDVRQLTKMVDRLTELPDELGTAETLLADAGYFSANNTEHCEAKAIAPLIARRRDQHYTPWFDREEPPCAPPPEASAVERMAHRLQTEEGRALYALRKQTVEPVFGIIKQAMRFRQFLLRGQNKVSGEWKLVAMAYNLRRMAKLAPAG